jgi:cell division protein FtsQ
LKEKYLNDNFDSQKEAKRRYKRKMEKRRKRALKFFRSLLLTVLIIGTLVLLALSPLFNISRIDVYGNNEYTADEVIGVTDLVVGNNWFRTNGLDFKSIFLFRSIKAEKSIMKKCHYVQNVSVRLSFPNVVRIALTERVPVAIVPYSETNLLMDDKGYILDSKVDVSKYKLPQILGLSLDNCVLGQAVNAEDKKKVELFNMVLDEIRKVDNDKVYDSSKAILKHVNYVDVSDWDNICILLDSRIRVNLGNYRKIGDYRLSFLREIFFNKLAETDKGYLDFTTGENPNFIPDK